MSFSLHYHVTFSNGDRGVAPYREYIRVTQTKVKVKLKSICKQGEKLSFLPLVKKSKILMSY